jgi:integrase
MKMEKEHRVPLAPRALEILSPFKGRRDDELMFTGFSSNTLRRVFKQIAGREYTVHGLRATHRTWAAEETNFSTDVCEAAIAHYATGTEAAYNRGALLEKRRKLMERWAVYCCTPATERGKVLPIAGRMVSLSQPRAINAD